MKKVKKFLACFLIISALASVAGVSASAVQVSGSDSLELILYTMQLRKPLLWDGVKGCSNVTFKVDNMDWIREGIQGHAHVYMIAKDFGWNESKQGWVQTGTNRAETGDLEAKGYRKDVNSQHQGRIYYRNNPNRLMAELPTPVRLSV